MPPERCGVYPRGSAGMVETGADLTELLRLPGLGPRRVHALHYDLASSI